LERNSWSDGGTTGRQVVCYFERNAWPVLGVINDAGEVKGALDALVGADLVKVA